jgi:CDP-archaeol synthase
MVGMTAVRVLYLIAPAVAAGLLHAVVIKCDLLRVLARPLDGGRGILGSNKTWRGVVVMLAGSTASVGLQGVVDLETLALVDYREPLTLLLGLALGAGYSLAELPNSFVKRRLGVAPGRRARRFAPLQYVADQGDSVLGATLAVALFVRDAEVLVLVVAVGFALHAAIDRLLYALDVKELTP